MISFSCHRVMGASLFDNGDTQEKSIKIKCQHEWELQGRSPKVEIKKF